MDGNMKLRIGMSAGAVLLMLVGLQAPARAATPADTIVMAKSLDDMLGLDPAQVSEPTDIEVAANCYDRVMHFEPGDLTKLVGDTVESWTVSDDGKTFTFKVRPGQKFHSGNPLTAGDIAFSLQRVVILNKAPSFLLTQLGWNADNVKQLVQAVDPSTVRLTIVHDYAPSLVLSLLGSIVASVVDEKEVMAHAVDGDLGNAWLKTHDAGSGPFMLRAWTPDESVVLEAYPGYRLGAPRIKHVILRHTPEAAVQQLLLEKGDVDIARDLTADQIASLAGNPGIAITQHPSGFIWYMALNVKDDRLANPKVREALRYLVDYQGMARTFLKGQLMVHQAFWPSGFSDSLEDNPFSLNVAEARKLLAEAGYPNGFDIRMDTGDTWPFTEIAQSIQQSMALAGIRLDIQQHDYRQVLTISRSRQHQIALMHWAQDYMDPHSNASAFAYNPDNSDDSKTKNLAWRSSWYDPAVNAETEAALHQRDAAKRRQMYLDLQRRLQADSPFIVLFQSTIEVAARRDVKGFVVGPAWDLVAYRLMSK